MKLDSLDFKRKKLSESINLYKSQSGLSWKDLAEMLGFSYLKLKRWADATAFPKAEEDLDRLCKTLSLDKEDLFKVPSLSDLCFHSLQDLLDDYNSASGDSSTRSRVFLMVAALVYARLLQIPNTSLLVKSFDPSLGNIDVKSEAVFFNTSSFSLVGCHDYIKYYDYAAFLDTDVYDLKVFNSSVLDSFVK